LQHHLLSISAAAVILAVNCVGTTVAKADGSAGSGERFQRGHASWYQHGRRTANGEAFNPNSLTAAHRSLPFGSLVRVVNDKTGRSVVVRINDRGPFIGGRIIDLARGAARQLGMDGVATVSLYRLS
jgi:rare lipoprotein A